MPLLAVVNQSSIPCLQKISFKCHHILMWIWTYWFKRQCRMVSVMLFFQLGQLFCFSLTNTIIKYKVIHRFFEGVGWSQIYKSNKNCFGKWWNLNEKWKWFISPFCPAPTPETERKGVYLLWLSMHQYNVIVIYPYSIWLHAVKIHWCVSLN